MSADLGMANVKVAVGLWRKSGDDFAASCFQVLCQLLSGVAEVPLPAIAEVHRGEDLHDATLSKFFYTYGSIIGAAPSCVCPGMCYKDLPEAYPVILARVWEEGIWVALCSLRVAVSYRRGKALPCGLPALCWRSFNGAGSCRLLFLCGMQLKLCSAVHSIHGVLCQPYNGSKVQYDTS